jgi:hypothetical protein
MVKIGSIMTLFKKDIRSKLDRKRQTGKSVFADRVILFAEMDNNSLGF